MLPKVVVFVAFLLRLFLCSFLLYIFFLRTALRQILIKLFMRLLGGRGGQSGEASVDLLAWAKTVTEAARQPGRQAAFVQAVGRHKHRHFSSAYFLIFTCNTQQGKQTTQGTITVAVPFLRQQQRQQEHKQ